MTHRALRTSLQLALLGFVGWYLREHWSEYRNVFRQAAPAWGALALSAFLVLVAYVVLIQTWRIVVEAWGGRLSFGAATRIWFVSNLGKYVPGKVWAIAAMGTLAQEAGVSPAAAVGSSLVVQLVNLVTGFGVFLVAGATALAVPAGAVAAFAALAVTLLLAPRMLPSALRAVNRVSGRQFPVPHLPRSALWWAGLGTSVAWVLYGLAFMWFARGLSQNAMPGSLGDWTAVFVGPYLLGFIFLFSPGGLGVREIAMAEALQRTGLAAGALAALLVAASRVWLTVLEIVPGVVFLLAGQLRRSDPPPTPR